MRGKEVYNLLIRYVILIIIALPNLYLFYLILTPLTVYLTLFLSKIFYQSAALISNDEILINQQLIKIIPACVAGSAYYLLLILNLTTPMALKKRIKSIALLIFSFLAINLFRIIIFIALFFLGFQYFEITHNLVWYLGSTILVIAIWFGNVYLLKIKAIPVYTDMTKIFKDTKLNKPRKKTS